MLRLKLVFLLHVISRVVAFLFTIVTVNQRNNPSRTITSLFLIAPYGLSISSNCSGVITRFFVSLYAILLLLFFLGLHRGHLGLRALFGLFLSLQDYIFFNGLFVLEIETHLEGPILLRALLIEVGAPLNLGPSLNFIDCIN